jgi:hypothetical protein
MKHNTIRHTQINYNNFHEVVARKFGFVRWASINNKNIRLLCLNFYQDYDRFSPVINTVFVREKDSKTYSSRLTYDEFLTELDKEFRLTSRSEVELFKVNKSYMINAVLFFLKDFRRKLDKLKRQAIKQVSTDELKELTEVPVPGVSLHQSFPTVQETEAKIMLEQIMNTLDEDERHLVLYKLGRISNKEVKEYFGGVSDTIISRRWKKLQRKLDLEFGGK